MYGHVPLRICDLKQNVGEFLSDVFSSFRQKCSSLVERVAHDKDVVSTVKRDAGWVEYTEAMDAQLAEVVRTKGESSTT